MRARGQKPGSCILSEQLWPLKRVPQILPLHEPKEPRDCADPPLVLSFVFSEPKRPFPSAAYTFIYEIQIVHKNYFQGKKTQKRDFKAYFLCLRPFFSQIAWGSCFPNRRGCFRGKRPPPLVLSFVCSLGSCKGSTGKVCDFEGH